MNDVDDNTHHDAADKAGTDAIIGIAEVFTVQQSSASVFTDESKPFGADVEIPNPAGTYEWSRGPDHPFVTRPEHWTNGKLRSLDVLGWKFADQIPLGKHATLASLSLGSKGWQSSAWKMSFDFDLNSASVKSQPRFSGYGSAEQDTCLVYVAQTSFMPHSEWLHTRREPDSRREVDTMQYKPDEIAACQRTSVGTRRKAEGYVVGSAYIRVSAWPTADEEGEVGLCQDVTCRDEALEEVKVVLNRILW